jgi:hypothetical protein
MRLASLPPSVLLEVITTALRVVQILNILSYRAAWSVTLERVIFAFLLYCLFKRLIPSVYFTLLRNQIHFLYQNGVGFYRYVPFSFYELDPFSRKLVWTLCQLRPLDAIRFYITRLVRTTRQTAQLAKQKDPECYMLMPLRKPWRHLCSDDRASSISKWRYDQLDAAS